MYQDEQTLAYLFIAECVAIFIWLMIAALNMKTILKDVESKLDEQQYFSLNIFLAMHGFLHYGTMFLSSYHAKRYKLTEKLPLIPKKQKYFFVAMLLSFLIIAVLMAGTVYLYPTDRISL